MNTFTASFAGFVGFVGFVIGALFFALLIIAVGGSEKQVTDKFQKEAVNRGHAEWVVSTNSDSPEVVFKWK
jgi:hypothetical protein